LAVARAAQFIQSLCAEELNSYMKKTRDHAVSTYGWINRDAGGTVASGAAVEYSRIYHDTYDRLYPNQEKVESFTQAVARAQPTERMSTPSVLLENPSQQMMSLVSDTAQPDETSPDLRQSDPTQ
jgi:hypothetical protein